jgi:hypothetical protein
VCLDPQGMDSPVECARFDWQRRGLGTLLLERLAQRAREEDMERFTALVLAKNEDMLDMLGRLGPTKVVSRSQGAVQVEAAIPPAGIGGNLRSLLKVAAKLTELLPLPERPELDSNQRPTP